MLQRCKWCLRTYLYILSYPQPFMHFHRVLTRAMRLPRLAHTCGTSSIHSKTVEVDASTQMFHPERRTPPFTSIKLNLFRCKIQTCLWGFIWFHHIHHRTFRISAWKKRYRSSYPQQPEWTLPISSEPCQYGAHKHFLESNLAVENLATFIMRNLHQFQGASCCKYRLQTCSAEVRKLLVSFGKAPTFFRSSTFEGWKSFQQIHHLNSWPRIYLPPSKRVPKGVELILSWDI